jgi:hypothetical protein
LYTELVISLASVLLLLLLDKMGKGVVLREIVAFLYAFTCLVMPVIGYAYYTRSNFLAKLWVKYMPVPANVYFPYALPAIALFCLALTFPYSPDTENGHGEGVKNLIGRIRTVLAGNKNISLVILGLGSAISLTINYLPAGLKYFGTLFFFGSFAGFLYLYFSPNFRNKRWLLLLFGAFTLYNSIAGGMFTIVAYMGINIVSFMVIGKSAALWKKALIFVIAAFFLIALQKVKVTYRSYIWHSNYTGNKMALFVNIFWENIQKGDNLIENTTFFPVYVRANQGYNVSMVMRRFPNIVPYDGGANILRNFASAFVPRFLWPDKPEAGGKFNMAYYAGFNLVGYSTNVGPLGEAYGSFGVTGGIIYMFLLGLFIRWAYTMIFKIARRIPLLVCWIPVMFYQVISSGETDSLQIFNSLIKSAFFLWLLYKFVPAWFGIKPDKKPGAMKKSVLA